MSAATLTANGSALTRSTRGIELWRGPSEIDGAPIVVLATLRSVNRKTGDMVQTTILRADVKPTDTLATGADESVCGSCRHRPKCSGGNGTCYVNVGHMGNGPWGAWDRGSYPALSVAEAAAAFRGRFVRFGAYGDPGAVPSALWESIAAVCDGWTGYTHRWRERPDLRPLCMASVDDESEAAEAAAMGWRYFRVKGSAEAAADGEIGCPAAPENGARVQCIDCRLCYGSGANRFGPLPSIVIDAHGAAPKMHNIRKVWKMENGS